MSGRRDNVTREGGSWEGDGGSQSKRGGVTQSTLGKASSGESKDDEFMKLTTIQISYYCIW